MSSIAEKTRNRLIEKDSKNNLKNFNLNKKRNKGIDETTTVGAFVFQ
jgi:hypothetical protein